MDPLMMIAADRQREMQATAATERLAAELRRARPRRASMAAVALAGVVARMRHTAPTPTPCTTC